MISGLLAAFTKKSLWFHFIVSVVTFIGSHQWLALFISMTHSLRIRDVGVVGLEIYKFNLMTNMKTARLELTESQLLTIKDQIKNWRTKEKVIDMMRYRYGRLEDQAA